MKFNRTLLATVAFSGMATVSGAAVAAFDLSNCDGFGTDCPYVTYGDGNSYNLAVNASLYDLFQGGGTGPGNPFYVASNPGAIKNLIVNATGASGTQLNTNFSGMDNAYPTPSGTGGAQFFTMNKTAYGLPAATPNQTLNGITVSARFDPGNPGQQDGIPFLPEFTGDQFNTWDTTTAALTGFLGAGNTPIFFFNNNQTNSGTSADQSLAVWAQVTLTDSSGVHTALVFDFTNNTGSYFVNPLGGGVLNGNPALYTHGGVSDLNGADPLAGNNDSTDYVLAGGQTCFDPDTGALTLPVGGVCQESPGPNNFAVQTVNNNLGANQAAYAVVFPELNAALLSGLYDSMHVDLRYGCDPNTTDGSDADTTPDCLARSANNGYEQLFIAAAAGTTCPDCVNVPEPATLALLGLGLVGLGLARRKAGPV